ncbi:hypothetical protein Tco_0936787 [Tanacetum coccineum]|uniref:Uncharacterized protein n=1 Tax=Tanacetum coccineum TaxID=301880 RepID=A0ABQ5DDG5_9ASTR
MQLEERQLHSNCSARFKELKTHLEFLQNTYRRFEIAFRIFFQEDHELPEYIPDTYEVNENNSNIISDIPNMDPDRDKEEHYDVDYEQQQSSSSEGNNVDADIGPSNDSDRVTEVPHSNNNTFENVFAHGIQSHELPESILDTYEVNANNSNIISDIPNMDPDRDKEEHDDLDYEQQRAFFASLINNLKCDVEKYNEVNREAQQVNVLLRNELERYKEKEKHFAKDKKIKSEYFKKIKLLNDKISNLKSQACEKDKTFAKENEKYDEYVQPLLKTKNKLENRSSDKESSSSEGNNVDVDIGPSNDSDTVTENNSNIIYDIPNMDPDRDKEEHDDVNYEQQHAFFASLINNLKCDVEKYNEVNREAQQVNVLLRNELEIYKEKEKHFAKDKTIESDYCKKIKLLNDEISNLKSQACEKDKTFAKENEKYDELRKAGQTDQTLRMLLPKEDNVNTGKQGLCFKNQNDDVNPSLLNKARELAPCLYNIDEMGKDLLLNHKIISEEELKCEAEKRLKVKQRKSPLSYHGFVYADTQFEEPPKVHLKRRNVNLKKKHLEQT